MGHVERYLLFLDLLLAPLNEHVVDLGDRYSARCLLVQPGNEVVKFGLEDLLKPLCKGSEQFCVGLNVLLFT